MPNFIALGCLEVGEKFSVGGWGGWGGVGWGGVGAFRHQLQSQTNLSQVRLMLSWVVTTGCIFTKYTVNFSPVYLKPDARLFCSKDELISLPIQTKGYQWMMNYPKSQDILKVRSSYFVLSSAAKFDTDLKVIVKKYLNSYFDSFDEWNFFK